MIHTSSSIPSVDGAINTKDPQWQADPKYKPDKDELWTYPASDDGWIKAHDAIRYEVDTFLRALESFVLSFSKLSANTTNNTNTSNTSTSTNLPEWTTHAIEIFWRHHEKHVSNHHSNEDDIMNPFMKKRVNLPQKLEADHEIIIEKMNDITHIVKEEIVGVGVGVGIGIGLGLIGVTHLIAALQSYIDILFPHLLEEESIALPLLRSYFAPDEVRIVIFKIFRNGSKGDSGSFIYAMGGAADGHRHGHDGDHDGDHDAQHQFRSQFMKQEGIPFFAWHVKFKHDYRFFKNHVHCHIDALLDGGMPTKKKKKMATMFCC